MRFQDLNWFDIESYLKKDNRLILILGACEQHGYLSLLTDIKIPLALADAASQQTGVIIAPELNFGVSPYFLAYPGTISLRVSTFLDLVEDVIRSVYAHGFRRILIVNGHGGNDPARARIYEVVNELSDLHIAWYSWWQSHSVEAIAQKYELKPYHASWLEAFPFTTVASIPAGDKIPPEVPGLLNARQSRELFGDGVFGGAYQASSDVMQELFSACLQDILVLLRFG
jgi:creatinine amidohydrolase